jgi:hypothetical protein
VWSNLFEHLPTDEREIPEIRTPIPTTSKVIISKFKYALESSDEDEQLTAIIFMKDMNGARGIVAMKWALFKDGQTAYTTAAEVENAATSTFFRLHSEFIETNPTLEHHSDLLEFLKTRPQEGPVDGNSISHTDSNLACERVATIREHCFTKPLEAVVEIKLTVNPLQSLDDATLGLTHAEM